MLNAMPDVFVGVRAGNAHGFGDQLPELGRVVRGVQRQPRENAAPDIKVLVGDELAQRDLLPLCPQIGDSLALGQALRAENIGARTPVPRPSSGFRSSTTPGPRRLVRCSSRSGARR